MEQDMSNTEPIVINETENLWNVKCAEADCRNFVSVSKVWWTPIDPFDLVDGRPRELVEHHRSEPHSVRCASHPLKSV
jgi:hypothetical protein